MFEAPPGGGRRVAREVRRASLGFLGQFGQNMSLGALALGLSIFLWVFISNEQNPPRAGILPVRIPVQPVNVPQDLDLLGRIEPVVVRVSAPTDLWGQMNESTVEATVDLDGMKEGEGEAPVRVQSRDARVKVLEVIPTRVRVELDVLRRQVVPVQINFQQGPPLGFASEQPRFDPEQVIVQGPERLVAAVSAAVADVNLSTARSLFRQSLQLVPRASRGYDISGVRVEPHTVVVEVPITRQINYVSVAVAPELRGSPSPGYWVAEARVSPLTVAVVGPQDVLQPLGAVKTQPIDVGLATASFSRIIGLDLPLGVNAVDRNQVQVDVVIRPVSGTAVFQVAPQLVGVPPGFSAQLDVPAVSVVVAGEGPSLRELTADKITVTVNAGGRSPGIYVLVPQVVLPPNIRLVRATPEQVGITIR
ncbi:MAG: hypothetical protein EXR51_11230 [Dehalococcoidia bacterium]|nr:hypothetical protein [Dehalococcoidia bacterium]